MFQKISVKNFRCFENFHIDFNKSSSIVMFGKNGSGKSTVGSVIEVMQKIANRTNRVGELLRPIDMNDQSETLVEFKVQVKIEGKEFTYVLKLELPERFRELRVYAESLSVDGDVMFDRELAQVRLARGTQSSDSSFGIDWHLVALPIIQTSSTHDPIAIFKKWLSRIIILRPIPSLMKGDSDTETLQPVISVENFGEWFSGVLVTAPSAYERFASFLKEVMPDIESVKNPSVGRDSRSIFVSFDDRSKSIDLSFNFLSDGEKCFFISALLIASTKVSDPFVCFWDEPDNYFAPHEVSPVITSLRRAFRDPFQLLITSHNVDAIKRFSDENTFHLYRKSHIETPRAESVEELKQRFPTEENFLDRLVDGDVDL